MQASDGAPEEKALADPPNSSSNINVSLFIIVLYVSYRIRVAAYLLYLAII